MHGFSFTDVSTDWPWPGSCMDALELELYWYFLEVLQDDLQGCPLADIAHMCTLCKPIFN